MTENALDLRGLTEGALNVIRKDLDAAQAGTKEVPTKHLIAYADNLYHMLRSLQEQLAALTDPRTAPFRAALALYDCGYYDADDLLTVIEDRDIELCEREGENKLSQSVRAVCVPWRIKPTKTDEEYIADFRSLLTKPLKVDQPNV